MDTHQAKGRLPVRVWVADLLLVVLLGFIDYRTGDYAFLIFYMIPVALGAWFVGIRFAMVVAVICGIVRFYADYQLYPDFSLIRYVNVVGDGLFLLIVAVMTSVLRLVLGKK